MSVASALAAGQRAAESRMLDTFQISVPTGAWQPNPETGIDEQVMEPLFTTRGRVKVGGGLAARASEAGGRTVVSVVRELHIPVYSPAVPTGAVAVCTSAHPTSDPTLEGARLRLSGPSPGSQTTARRLQVEEVLT